MGFAVQCPEAKCRKYMLVEEYDRGKVVPCLICKAPIRVGDPTSSPRSEPTESQFKNRPNGKFGQ